MRWPSARATSRRPCANAGPDGGWQEWQIRSILWCWLHNPTGPRGPRCLALSPFAAYVIWAGRGTSWRSAIVGSNYDIILIGLVAVFLILRLRAVLGKRTGNERPPATRDPFTPPQPPAGNTPRIGDAPAQSGNDNVIPLPNAGAPAEPRPSLS